MIKVSKTVKGDDKMNTKDYIETQKSKKLSDIFKGVLAAGLVVGSMVTSTACKPNQPHESTSTTNSSTSTIETTNTTQQTTATETTKIDEPIVRTDEQVENFKKALRNIFDSGEILDNQFVVFLSRYNDKTGDNQYRFVIQANSENGLNMVFFKDISKEEFFTIFNDFSKNGKWSQDELSEKSFSIKQVIENCSGESLDILAEAINSKFIKKQSTNQSSQDDLVR
ncbi:MAG: hypothetical protein KIG44_05525 [Eubacteriales bacterium]|nr:hypothetical protein [Eubacteriales bacterium]